MATVTPSSPPAPAPAPMAVADGAAISAARRRAGRRLALVIAIGIAAVVGLALSALLLGAANLTPDRVLAALLGFGGELDRFVVFKLRLPRILAALLVGVAFALAGAVFQSTLRNPLASPDILGISAGASLGAVWALLVLGAGGILVSASAFGGAVLVALVIWAAAWRQGLHGIRFVLVGVGLAYVCGSTVAWLLARSDVREAQTALHWTVGSIADVRGDDLATLAIGVAVATVGVAVFSRVLAPLSIGDDHARALGVGVDRARLVLLLLAVALVATATSVAGPIAFIALLAPAIARRLVGDGGAALAASAVVGAVLTLGADLIGQFALPGLTAPVGIVTGVIGAPYLLWLLATSERKSRA